MKINISSMISRRLINFNAIGTKRAKDRLAIAPPPQGRGPTSNR